MWNKDPLISTQGREQLGLASHIKHCGKRLMPWLSSMFLAALTFGCTVEETPRTILEPLSENARTSLEVWDLLLLINGVVMVIIAIVFVFAIFRFRRKEGDNELPPQTHGNMTAEIAWTIIPTLIIIAILVPTIEGIFAIDKDVPEGEELVDIAVVGKQWWWEYDYLKPPVGEAPPAVDFSTANEMHVEVDTWVRLRVTSADVIHAFWVPRMFGKRDATPGRSYPIVFKPEQPGEFVGQCAELCGASHALMGIKLFVHPKEGPNSYKKWLKNQRAVAEDPATPSAQRGKELFLEKACNRCHTIRGDSRTEIRPSARRRETGPDLTHVGSRSTIAALTVSTTRENLAKWIHDPASIKEAALMADPRFNKVKVSEEDAAHIAAYLHRLK